MFRELNSEKQVNGSLAFFISAKTSALKSYPLMPLFHEASGAMILQGKILRTTFTDPDLSASRNDLSRIHLNNLQARSIQNEMI